MSWPVRKVIRPKCGVPIRPSPISSRELAQRRLEAEVLVHHQRHAGRSRRPRPSPRNRPGSGRTAFARWSAPSGGREFDQRPVRGHRGRDVDEVGLRARAAWSRRRCNARRHRSAWRHSRPWPGRGRRPATSSTSGIVAQAFRWFSAKKPQPMTVPRRRWLIPPPPVILRISSRSRMPVRDRIDQHRDEDDHADDQRIDVRVGVGHHQAVLHRLDQHGAEHRADHAAPPAEQRGAAQDRGGDHRELLLEAEGGGGGGHLAGGDQPADRRR